jgi:serine/threonine-protein kinase
MGEVYRARDTKLGRDVAVKVLPAAVALDPDRLARFTREAQVLASLNHANIAAIYGVEEGPSLILELVEGPTLADRIAHGPIPIGEAVPIARQIADALEEAHRRGIIHRDLKPANIKVRGDGSVKVLDFGLAKLIDAGPTPSRSAGVAQQDPAYTATPTLTSPALMTGVGIILGTATYMSPEQARGKELDARADIWAFGCVLYEMLTGRRAFPGDDVTETIAAVVKSEPEWSALPHDLPAALRVYLRRCLEKEPRNRVSSIGDMRLALDGAFDLPQTPSAPAPWRTATTALGVVLALVAGAVAAWLLKPAPAISLPVSRFPIAQGTAPLSIANNNRDLAVTPDGRRVIFFAGQGAQRALYVRSLEGLDSVAIRDASRWFEPFVSADGKWVGFNDETGYMLKKIALSGGPPTAITQVGAEIFGAAWAEDDSIVFGTVANGLQRVSANGGTPVALTQLDTARGEVAHRWPDLIPGGKGVVFAIRGRGDQYQLAALNLATNAITRFNISGSSPRFSATGHLVYSAGNTLRAVRFNATTLSVEGEPIAMVDGVFTKPSGGTSFAIGGDGTLAYVPGNGFGTNRQLVLFDRQGRHESLDAPRRAYALPRFSPDGTRAALDVRDQEGDIWIWDFSRHALTRLTSDPAADQAPAWTPDGSRIVFNSTRAGAPNLYWQTADGTSAADRLTDGPEAHTAQSFTPDGSTLLFRTEARTSEDMFLLSPGTHEPPRPLLASRFNERNAAISLDGKWIAYQSDETGQFEIYVRPFPDVNRGRVQVTGSGGFMPAWSRSELFYIHTDGTLVAAPITPGPAFSTGPAKAVVPAGFYVAPSSRSYDVTADGRRVLTIDASGADATANRTELIVVLNWHEELKRLLPR